MQNIITQVPQSGGGSGSPLLQDPRYGGDPNQNYYESGDDAYGSSLIHLNIQENHYFITRDQLMSLPESLLLCLFPSGVFLDRDGQIITNLTPEDEVYIVNFAPDCFEYIMEVFTKAHDDLVNHPVEKLFERSSSNNLVKSAKGFFGFGSGNSNNNSGTESISSGKAGEHDLLHQNPVIIVLREDLDYYCVPREKFEFEAAANPNLTQEQINDNNDDLLHHFMAQVKVAAGSYLSDKSSIFQGLFSSNRLKYQNYDIRKPVDARKEKKLGPAEQHLMDMLCSSGFDEKSQWGNRTQEGGKTVISSLSLCRLANETTQEFRDTLEEVKSQWLKERAIQLQNMEDNNANKLTPTSSSRSLKNYISGNNSNSNTVLTPMRSSATTTGITNNLASTTSNVITGTKGKEKRKSRLSALANNVRMQSQSRSNSQARAASNGSLGEMPRVYDLVPKPDINAKLLLFWRKPARKCWWGDEEIDLDVEIYGDWADKEHRTMRLKLPASADIETELNKVRVPVRLHIRRVWTLELSVIGVQ
ncbi:Whi2p KNAG_0B03040 [Huiozyma naganishii CBS 8797]|uniref:Growth regulation protein n=1 Tax=Huiozyma naganishii (strain ATCC MYA-139 / BCRC 22969 / CBS 8797 / KCTC 17520 / NBRC 10181 / NCYC 3082 / Yp74L-3) TaxID=1071383 RepID=J7S4R4_HUIN7|nr:hypothetical protein KNAG_0B03040 [Kazachstania naganishii CBS 8797]CCK68746.1 hypothetical protein KNAG_0B03040 [Kazachstania naganishii CBS 8797]